MWCGIWCKSLRWWILLDQRDGNAKSLDRHNVHQRCFKIQSKKEIHKVLKAEIQLKERNRFFFFKATYHIDFFWFYSAPKEKKSFWELGSLAKWYITHSPCKSGSCGDLGKVKRLPLLQFIPSIRGMTL